MNLIKKNQLYLTFSIIFLLPYLFGCATTVPSIRLSPEERSSIQKLAVSCIATPQVSFEIDVPLDASLIYTSPSGYLGGAVSAAWSAAWEEVKFEEAESRKLSLMLIDWNFRRVFIRTFCKQLSNQSSLEVIEMNEPVSRKDIKNKRGSLFGNNIDSVVDIHIAEYGIQSKKEGFAVFAKATVEIINLRTNKVVASHTIKFDYDYANLNP